MKLYNIGYESNHSEAQLKLFAYEREEKEGVFEGIEEFFEGFLDLIEDIFEDIFKLPQHPRRPIPIDIGGAVLVVQPAFLFAQRVNSFTKALVGVSLFGSVLSGTVWGFPSTKDFLLSLVTHPVGFMAALLISFCVALVGIWETVKPRPKKVEPEKTPQSEK